MANSGLNGPFELTEQGIDYSVTLTSPGAYVLGKQGGDGKFYISYVGRSDNDVNDRLHDWIGKYSQFKFGYLESPEMAFVKECNLYHDFGGPEKGLDNEVHPQRPENSNWQCPRCNVFSGQSANW
jgi:hypothetical protein